MIIIVGAGLAGLSAAYKLKRAGYDQFKIVEAKPRVGGRIESIYNARDSSRLDLGAQWLHGERENPIYEWLKELDCIEGLEDEEVEFEGLFRFQTGREPDRRIVFKILDILMETKGVLYKMSSQLDASKCRPIDMYHERINEAIRGPNPVLGKDTDRKLIDSVVKWFELYEMIDNSCENFALLSMKAYSCWSDFDDGKMVKLKGGWQNVVNKLVDFVGQDKFQLNCPVKQIDYSTSRYIDVVCQDNSSFRCNHVIVTLSVGALKHLLNFSSSYHNHSGNNQCDTTKHDCPFLKPGLSPQRVADINAIGFGVANKIFLEFERPYLQDEKGLKLLWFNDAPSILGELPLWAKCITGFDVIDDAPNYLLAWIGAEGAHEMEEFSEQEVGSICLRIFSLFIPEKRPPRLISVKRSCWSTDPYIRGSYSYQSIDLISRDTDHLWDPICDTSSSPNGSPIPRVMFAGEATAGNLYSTAHGAIVSGWREADRLADYFKSCT